MTPHPVYIPTGIVRQLRALLNERDTVTGQRKAWLVRAGTLLQAAGLDERNRSGKGWIEKLLQQPDGIDEQVKLALERCDRMALALTDELAVRVVVVGGASFGDGGRHRGKMERGQDGGDDFGVSESAL